MANKADKIDLRKVPADQRPQMPEDVKAQIYKITCKSNGKIYVGQTRSHVMNKGKYRPFGYMKRWKQHLSESKANYKCQSSALNACIKEKGEEDFLVELLEECSISDAHARETHHVGIYKSFESDHGLNLTSGGKSGPLGEEQKERISNTLREHFAKKENVQELSKNHVNRYDKDRIDKIKSFKDIKKIKITKYANAVKINVSYGTDSEYETTINTTRHSSIEDVIARSDAIVDAVKQDNIELIYKP